MAFRMRNTRGNIEEEYEDEQSSSNQANKFSISKVTDYEFKYKTAEVEKFIPNISTKQYPKEPKPNTIDKEALVYDKNKGEWIIVKESQKYKYI